MLKAHIADAVGHVMAIAFLISLVGKAPAVSCNFLIASGIFYLVAEAWRGERRFPPVPKVTRGRYEG